MSSSSRPSDARARLTGLAALGLGVLGLAGPAHADPRCARYGRPSYSAIRVIELPGAPPVRLRAFIAEGGVRTEGPGPHGGSMVTLNTTGLSAMFASTAEPRVAMRLPPPPRRPELAPDAVRQRELREGGRISLLTEVRDDDGQWREVEAVICRPDGVLLEARQPAPRLPPPQMQVMRQSEIRLGPQDPALFRLPEGFRLIDPPPPPAGPRR